MYTWDELNILRVDHKDLMDTQYVYEIFRATRQWSDLNHNLRNKDSIILYSTIKCESYNAKATNNQLYLVISVSTDKLSG